MDERMKAIEAENKALKAELNEQGSVQPLKSPLIPSLNPPPTSPTMQDNKYD